jgi:hypothetical protein
MNSNIIRSAIAAAALCGVMVTSIQAPARADGAATTRTIIGAAAAIAGIATVINVEHKHQQATTIQGYLPDGSTVYADGHVVAPNGYSWYPGNQGEQVACNNQQFAIYGNGQYGYNGYNGNNGYYGNNGGYGNGQYGNGYYNNGQYYPEAQRHRHGPGA